MRLGLCCLFRQEPIRFRTTTAKALLGLEREERLERLSTLCEDNAASLVRALQTVVSLGIGAFRITSRFFPRCTHPEVGYDLDDLPGATRIRGRLAEARSLARLHDVRLSFHADPFVVLSTDRPDVLVRSRRELASLGRLADLVGAEVIVLHGGSARGGKGEALRRFRAAFASLPGAVRLRLALENDDRVYTVADLVPVCEDLGVPLVYDVHHHRCNGDGLTEEEATGLALATWAAVGKEPWFHLASPRDGWDGGDPRPHADYVDPADFPPCWEGLHATVDCEAKAKELAVLRLTTRARPPGPDSRSHLLDSSTTGPSAHRTHRQRKSI